MEAKQYIAIVYDSESYDCLYSFVVENEAVGIDYVEASYRRYISDVDNSQIDKITINIKQSNYKNQIGDDILEYRYVATKNGFAFCAACLCIDQKFPYDLESQQLFLTVAISTNGMAMARFTKAKQWAEYRCRWFYSIITKSNNIANQKVSIGDYSDIPLVYNNNLFYIGIRFAKYLTGKVFNPTDSFQLLQEDTNTIHMLNI